ncbi:histidine phosphatase superfamily [Lactarius quietus]|nr:histidine phosphatase superfamily [Lactarius quietus]
MSSSVTFTFIRHGESTDNLRSVWAGFKDAPSLITQARALGDFFADTHFTAIHASDLKRAFTTAQAVHDRQKDPKPSFDSSELLREQNFGVAEGKPWSFESDPTLTLEEQMAKGVYPAIYGESPNDLNERARTALAKFVLPHVLQAAKDGKTGIHVAIVSHGLCISALTAELLKKSAKQSKETDHRGLWNTAWTRVVVDIEPRRADQRRRRRLPFMVMRVTHVNSHSHLDNIKRQKGIGSAAYDPRQEDIRAFFAGKSGDSSVSEGKADANKEGVAE